MIAPKVRAAALALTLAATGFMPVAAEAASTLTARASGQPAVRTGPGSGYRAIDELDRNERVRLDVCTRESRWCRVVRAPGHGPDGWVLGSYLVGSPAKSAVSPFPLSFDPLYPRGVLRHRPSHRSSAD